MVASDVVLDAVPEVEQLLGGKSVDFGTKCF